MARKKTTSTTPTKQAAATPAPGAAQKTSKPTKPTAPPKALAAASGGGILAWEDDPQSGAPPIARPVPDLSAGPLALTISTPAPPAQEYPLGSPEFRYWAAAEAVRRAADFWGGVLPSGTKWQPGGALSVRLDMGVDLNAYYDRTGLSFFHDTVGGQTVYSGESPDIVCHELGHAVLDSFRPELWDAGFDEAAAFHESFGDMSALLSALQLPSLRQAVLDETGGRVNRASRLSRLAEQLGWAIRQVRSDLVDPDCLRNAVNTLYYQSPTTLAPSGPAAALSSEPHSFSRVFTGAFFEALAGIVAVLAPASPKEDDLRQASLDAGNLLISAILGASIVPDYYSQVAGSLIHAGEAPPFNGKYRDVLKGAFIRHGLLSLESATSGTSATSPAPPPAGSPMAAVALAAASGQPVSLSGQKFGLGTVMLLVHTPQVPHRFLAAAASLTRGSVAHPDHVSSVNDFVTDLFRRGRVDCGEHGDLNARVTHPLAKKTHRIEREGDQLKLVRTRFDCGFGHIANF